MNEMDERSVVDGNGERESRGPARSSLLLLAILLGGISIGQVLPRIDAALAADPTAAASPAALTSAELEELERLRTQVAQPAVCSPEPTLTPTSTPTPEPTATIVPAQSAGTAVIDSRGLAITVSSIQQVPTPDGIEAAGQLLRLNVVIANDDESPKRPPFANWRLVDANGSRYSIHMDATNEIAGSDWGVSVAAHAEEERAVIFDVAVDAGTTFVLENEDDPLFRIEVTLEERG